VAYCSRALTSYESAYCSQQIEILAGLFAMERWRHFFQHTVFLWIVDCTQIRWILSAKSGRIWRWRIRLSTYRFHLTHRTGAKIVAADALSCNPGLPPRDTNSRIDWLLSESPESRADCTSDDAFEEFKGFRIPSRERPPLDVATLEKRLRS
jgi:hypothetical protein